MKNRINRVMAVMFGASAIAWLATIIAENIELASLFEFGTVRFNAGLQPDLELESYRTIAKVSIAAFFIYPAALLSGYAYLRTSGRTLKHHGWMLMSLILVVLFIPVELYSFWLDWKIVGLVYWGEWSIEEFRKALLNRVMALGGLNLIAQLCYFTIPFFIIFKPLQKTDE